jgi:hypothetical protein
MKERPAIWSNWNGIRANVLPARWFQIILMRPSTCPSFSIMLILSMPKREFA